MKHFRVPRRMTDCGRGGAVQPPADGGLQGWLILGACVFALATAAMWPALAASPENGPAAETAAEVDEKAAFGETEAFGEGSEETAEGTEAEDSAAAPAASEAPESPPLDVLPPLSNDDFRPTERLRADQEVDFPVDI